MISTHTSIAFKADEGLNEWQEDIYENQIRARSLFVETIPCNQCSIIMGHLVYQHRRLRVHAFQVDDFVAIHLVVITADNLNACIHFLYFCSSQCSMLKMVSERLFL